MVITFRAHTPTVDAIDVVNGHGTLRVIATSHLPLRLAWILMHPILWTKETFKALGFVAREEIAVGEAHLHRGRTLEEVAMTAGVAVAAQIDMRERVVSKDNVCSECAYYKSTKPEAGQCYRYPPQILTVLGAPGPGVQDLRPVVIVTDKACGEFQKV